MKNGPPPAASIDAYIADFPDAIQTLLEQMRQTIQKAAPGSTEKMSYGIPTFHLNGNLVHFAAYANHIGFYPGARGISEFREELAAYRTSKGTVQFSLDAPLPLKLVAKIVKFRVKENLEKKARGRKK